MLLYVVGVELLREKEKMNLKQERFILDIEAILMLLLIILKVGLYVVEVKI
jgi:hypothetical protein